MTIDIKELRKVIADCYWPTSPVAINEILDRLEAAEKERDKLKELNIALCTKSNSQVIHNARLAEENDTLRAKIARMEQQEPVAWMLNCQTLGGDTGWILSWTQSGAGLCNRLSGEENEKKLYVLPGAKGE